MDNRYLSAEDSEFVQLVTSDINYFIKSSNFETVLLFPPIDDFHRLLIHKTTEEFSQLCSFSVGEGDNRRTAVCAQLLVLKSVKCDVHLKL
uniref:R3H domain-containing protein n=1 Tax=Capitella teleta TaxID=283909 RepID=X1YV95_CAPTE